MIERHAGGIVSPRADGVYAAAHTAGPPVYDAIMRRTGTADLPLHGGRAPAWLFQRMAKLTRALVLVMREDVEPAELLRRLSDPHWFQAFGCLLGFDWHSSGVTTTVCGALKQGLRGLEEEVGLFVAGGKGATSRKTPGEIAGVGDTLGRDMSALVYASRMAAKVDSAGLQDGYELYHHAFVFTPGGEWTVIQQGMNAATRYARRYHWLGETVGDFVSDPHAAIVAPRREANVLNLVAGEGDAHRSAITTLVRDERPETIVAELQRAPTLALPARHHIEPRQDIAFGRLSKILLETYERRPAHFEALLGQPGVGAKTLRALSLAAEVMYGVPASVRDPAVYAYAHGGKDGHPYPVDRATYDRTIAYLESAVRRSKLGDPERLAALRRLHVSTPAARLS